jgi:hypothetical protein
MRKMAMMLQLPSSLSHLAPLQEDPWDEMAIKGNLGDGEKRLNE